MTEQRDEPPIATARWVFDDAYYDLFYSDFVACRTWYRKHAIQISALIIAAGLIVLVATGQGFVSWVILGVGVFDLAETITHRWRWIRHAKRLQGAGHVCLEFTVSGINKPTGRSREQVGYDCFDRYVKTPKGLFLRVMKGLSLFIPESSISPPAATAALYDLLDEKIAGR